MTSLMPAVVSDASVLICLGAARQHHLLKEFFGQVHVPEAVWQEVTVHAASRAGAKEIVQAREEGWLKVETAKNRSLVAALRSKLDAGEAEAIALAAELAAGLLLMDESDGRSEARALGLRVTGTLGVLLRARHAGALPALKPVLDALMKEHHFRLSRPLYEQALRECGELT